MNEERPYTLHEPVAPGIRERVPAGTALLVTGEGGPTRDINLSTLQADRGEGVVFVTEGTADEACSVCADRAEHYWCIATEGDAGECGTVVEGLDDVSEVAVALATLLSRAEDRGVKRLRVGFDGLDTLLAGADPALAFRFLHLFTGRVRSGGLLAVAHIDPARHDPATVSNVRALFDGVLEVRATDDGREARLRGIDDIPGRWAPIK